MVEKIEIDENIETKMSVSTAGGIILVAVAHNLLVIDRDGHCYLVRSGGGGF